METSKSWGNLRASDDGLETPLTGEVGVTAGHLHMQIGTQTTKKKTLFLSATRFLGCIVITCSERKNLLLSLRDRAVLS